jgi:hypothetical protein
MQSEIGTQEKISIVVHDTADEGSKGLYDMGSVALTRVVELTEEQFAEAVSRVSSLVQRSLASSSPVGAYKLSSVELSLELTTKGEVRLIAAGSIEASGCIKITFSL